MYYVYVYCNKKFLYHVPNDWGVIYLPFYVGKGKGNRYKSHMKSAKNNVLRKYLEKLETENNIPEIIKIKENLSEQEAFKLESTLIRFFQVIYSGKGSLMNKYLNGGIYNIHCQREVEEIVSQYEDLICSDPVNISRNVDFQSELRPYIKLKIQEYLKTGFTVSQCCSLFKVTTDQINNSIEESYIRKWCI